MPSAAATDDFYSEFAIRGSSSRHVGLVVDGVPAPYLMHSVHGVTDGGSIAMVNSDAVGNVSLMSGSFPQRVGRALGAEVDLELREGDRQRARARVGLSGTAAAMVAEGPLARGRGSWLVSGRRSYLDMLVKRIDDSGSFAFGFTDAEAKLVFDLTPRHQLQWLAIGGVSEFDEEPGSLGANDPAQSDGRSWLSGLAWRFTPSPRFTITQRLFTTGLRYETRNRDRERLDDSDAREFGWRADATAVVRPGLLVQFGGDTEARSRRHAQRRALNDAIALTTVGSYDTSGAAASAYGQVQLQTSLVTVSPGVRVDRWGPTRTFASSPWITAEVALAPRTRLRFGTGLYRQFPDFETIVGVRGGGRTLRPETAHHVDIGMSHELPLAMALQVNWYARNERDILWTPGAEPRRRLDGSIELGRGDARWVNALVGRARGVEVIARRDAPTGLSGWVGYAFGRHRDADTTSGDTFWGDVDQRHGLSLFGHYRLSNRSTISAKFRYGSNYPMMGYIGRQAAPPNAPPLFGGDAPVFYGLVDARNTLRLPAYARLDVRADRTFLWSSRRVTLFAEVANALNRQNQRNVPHGVDPRGRVVDPTETLLPIVPSAGFVIEF